MQLYAQNVGARNTCERFRDRASHAAAKLKHMNSKRRLKMYTSTVFHKIFHSLVETSHGLKVSL